MKKGKGNIKGKNSRTERRRKTIRKITVYPRTGVFV